MQLPVQNLETFHIEVAEVSLGVIVRIKGFLGMCHQAELHSHLAAVGRHGPRFVVLDLSKVEFIGGLAFCTLILFRKEIVRDGGTVRIAAMRP
jgi:anti-anti-sigma regulatory factor